MGCGKSTFGRLLSGQCACPFIDTDAVIEERSGKRIADIFAEEGEEAFRDMESALIKELAGKPDGEEIISCGGGLPVREENRKALKKAGFTVYLKAGEELLLKWLENGREERPMLSGGDLKERIRSLLSEREELYLKAADAVLELEECPEDEVLSELRKLWKERSADMKLLVINGPNLNFLGIRDKKVYGTEDYDALVRMIEAHARELKVRVECFQSNSEGAIIDRIQQAYCDGTEGIVINPGAYTHYSYAIRDALDSFDTIPMVEIHISDINAREEFRRLSVTAPVCDHQIVGHGLNGYLEAMDWIIEHGEIRS